MSRHFGVVKRLLQGIGSWVVRRLSGTTVPDATSGFRAFSRRAALRMNVVTKFTYTLETIIQAGKKHIPIGHFPIPTNEVAPSVAAVRVDRALRAALARHDGAHLRALRAAHRVRRPGRTRRADRSRGRLALHVRLAARRRRWTRPEPHPRRGAGDRRLPDDADRAGGRSDRQQPLADRGHAVAGARDRAAPGPGAGRRAARGGGRARAARGSAILASDDGLPVRDVRSAATARIGCCAAR